MPIRLIIVIIMLISTIIVGIFLLWPKFQDFQQVKYDIEQKESELSSKTAYYSKIRGIWSRLEEYNDVLLRIDAAFPSAYSVPALFYYLQKTAGESGLILEDLSLGRVSGEKIKGMDVSLKISGSYSSLNAFLSALENSERFFMVKNISFSSPEDGLFSFDLAITAHSY